MAQQLIYTSAPKLLDAGRSGFGTVARSRSLGALAAGAIERVSQFANLRGYDRDRVIHAYRRITAGSQKLHVLTRIRDCGSDYTGRTNHIAHHLVLGPEEVARAEARGLTPADVMRQFAWRDSWDGAPQAFEPSEDADLTGMQALGIASGRSAFARITGEPLHARLLAWNGAPRSGVMVVPEHGDPLELLAEACSEFPRQPWLRTFTTSLETTDELGDFDWVLVKSSAADLVLGRCGSRARFDLTKPASLPLPAEEVRSIPAPTAAAGRAGTEVRNAMRPPDGHGQLTGAPAWSSSGIVVESGTQMESGSPQTGARSKRGDLRKENRSRKAMLIVAAGVSILVGLVPALISRNPGVEAGGGGNHGPEEPATTGKDGDGELLSEQQPTEAEKNRCLEQLVALGVTRECTEEWTERTVPQLDSYVQAMKAIQNLNDETEELFFPDQPQEIKGLLTNINIVINDAKTDELVNAISSISGWGGHFQRKLLDNIVKWSLTKNINSLNNPNLQEKISGVLAGRGLQDSESLLSELKKNSNSKPATPDSPIAQLGNTESRDKNDEEAKQKKPEVFYLHFDKETEDNQFTHGKSEIYTIISKGGNGINLGSKDFPARIRNMNGDWKKLNFGDSRDWIEIKPTGLTFKQNFAEVEISHKDSVLVVHVNNIFHELISKTSDSLEVSAVTEKNKIILHGDHICRLAERINNFSVGYKKLELIFHKGDSWGGWQTFRITKNHRLEVTLRGIGAASHVDEEYLDDLETRINNQINLHGEEVSNVGKGGNAQNDSVKLYNKINENFVAEIKNRNLSADFGISDGKTLNIEEIKDQISKIRKIQRINSNLPEKGKIKIGNETVGLKLNWDN